METRIEDRHVKQLTDILVSAVKRMERADIKMGLFRRIETLESLKIDNVAENLQLDEGERNENGGYNPNIAGLVMVALEKALLMTGREVYDGLNQKILTYDSKSKVISSRKLNPNETPLEDHKVVSVGGTISLHSVYSIGMSGHNLKEALSLLSDEVLGSAAHRAIAEKIEVLIAYEVLEAAEQGAIEANTPTLGYKDTFFRGGQSSGR